MPKRVLIDSDAKNEIDDQYAIVRALIAPELRVEALTAAGFHDRQNGARLSYEEEVRILELMGLTGQIPVAMGSALPMQDKHTPRPTEATDLIIERAMADDDGPLYVLALGQFTNLASAWLIEPRIRERSVEVPAPIVHDDGTTTDAPDNLRRLTVVADIDAEEIYQSYWDAVEVATQ